MEQPLLDALAYWEGKRSDRRMPARRDLDPVLEVPRLLPWLILVDVLRKPLDFRYRLIGSGVVDRSGRNNTGKLISELPGVGPDSLLWRPRATVVATGVPLRCEPPYVGPTPGVHGVVALHLPLSDDGETVSMILTMTMFHGGSGQHPTA
ncbi:hypothetical protein N825_21675 [Skermanella stibiiresistens SB22]|uniref:PAS domain-containing protein n=1 Tax=Skermanella stibiiresistens SB22 TaxID=1385369 RepID=W9GZY9_9PROT|nr:PAS domain-containing protein [Skermanella stibiiresistens]EWY37058.1 hypothetical protein N825_21675 [Skermanella stibiiresistens SB22]